MMMVPLITESCLEVVCESADQTDYFIGKIDQMIAEQPHLFKSIIQGAHEATFKVIQDVESDEYIHIFVSMLAIAVQTYLSIDKQLGIADLERLYG